MFGVFPYLLGLVYFLNLINLGATQLGPPSQLLPPPAQTKPNDPPQPLPLPADPGQLLPPPPTNQSRTPTKCNPREYVQRGYCQKYFTCNRKSRLEIKRGCSDGLFWNPNYNAIHGGVCDYLRNIKTETLFEYKKDTKCVLDVAYFRSSGECDAKYFYNHPIRTEGKEIEETCPQGLLWSRQKESCEICSLVKKKDGSPCCDPSALEDY